jgi:hypothetical protein
VAQREGVVRVTRQRLLRPARDGLRERPVRVRLQPADDLGGGQAVAAGLDAHPAHDLRGKRVGGRGQGVGLDQPSGRGGSQRLAAGGPLRLGRPGLGGSGRGDGGGEGEQKEQGAAHATTIADSAPALGGLAARVTGA